MAQWNYILVAGEKEMAKGTVSVRYRDNQKLIHEMRVDKVAEMLKSEHPDPSVAANNFYAKAFDPAKFFNDEPEESKVAPKSEAKAPAKAPAAAAKQV